MRDAHRLRRRRVDPTAAGRGRPAVPPRRRVQDSFEPPKKAVQLMKASEYKEFGPVTKEEHIQEVARAKKEADDKKKRPDARLGDQLAAFRRLYFFAEKIFLDD